MSITIRQFLNCVMLKGKNIVKMNETKEVREVEEFERLRVLNRRDNWNENVNN